MCISSRGIHALMYMCATMHTTKTFEDSQGHICRWTIPTCLFTYLPCLQQRPLNLCIIQLVNLSSHQSNLQWNPIPSIYASLSHSNLVYVHHMFFFNDFLGRYIIKIHNYLLYMYNIYIYNIRIFTYIYIYMIYIDSRRKTQKIRNLRTKHARSQ